MNSIKFSLINILPKCVLGLNALRESILTNLLYDFKTLFIDQIFCYWKDLYPLRGYNESVRVLKVLLFQYHVVVYLNTICLIIVS